MSSIATHHATVKPAPKTRRNRSVRLLATIPTDAGVAGFLRVTQTVKGRKEPEVTTYSFSEIPCQLGGRGFVVEKVDPATGRTLECYHARIYGEHGTCDCRGFARHHVCKHHDGLTALVAADRI